MVLQLHRVVPRVLLASLALGASVAALPAAASPGPATPVASAPAGDVPAGFTDGIPVGGSDGQGGAAPATSGDTRATTTKRYFGREPWAAIQAAAAATDRPCAISNGGLTALTTAPVFKESSAATSPSTAPSPMTLSRYDEWTGTLATNTNQNANYGLYAFRDPNTPYKRAFWHPGIGIWQYDSAGVGAPYTAIERMDVRVVAADVAASMAARYCNPSASLIGHGAPFTDQERRNAAWTPWGYPCTLCEREFQAMTAGSTNFANISLVDGISVTGGAEQRTCTLIGVAGTIPCWYVDPSVGTIEGATGWATIAPLDGGSPTVRPTPIAEPFYVLDRGATEERHWLRDDTGYAIDISGTRQIGKNERPRSNQAGSGITWSRESTLCDITTGRGACVPPAPSGLSLAVANVASAFRPIALDVHGDDLGDVLWYAPGAAPDYLWSGTGRGTFSVAKLDIRGAYDDVLPLDVDADGDSDLLWYSRASGAAYLWRSDGDGTWTPTKLMRPPGLRPLVVDTDGDGRDEVLWYGPGSLGDSLWSWNGAFLVTRAQSISGGYLGLPADYDGDGRTDVLWYAPGAAADHVWYSTGPGTHRDVAISVSGSYWPLIGDYDGDGADDVFWYGPGAPPDSTWFGASGRSFTKVSSVISGSYQPLIADLEGDGRDDLVWYAPGSAADRWWRWTTGRVVTGTSIVANGRHQAFVGGFSTGGADGIFWYAVGSTPDGVWFR